MFLPTIPDRGQSFEVVRRSRAAEIPDRDAELPGFVGRVGVDADAREVHHALGHDQRGALAFRPRYGELSVGASAKVRNFGDQGVEHFGQLGCVV